MRAYGPHSMTTVRKWSLTLVTAGVTAAVLFGVTLLVVGTGNNDGVEAQPKPLRPLAGASGSPTQPPAVGPEGVPLQRGAPLGPARSPAPGKSRGGIPCGSGEQLTYHVHARVTLFVKGRPRAVPLGVGIAPPLKIAKNRGGPFVSGGSCFSFLHTHASDGIVHIEAPGPVPFKLGQFFDVWQQRLDERHLGRFSGRVVAYVNGRRYRGDPRAIPLRKHAQVQLQVGQPFVSQRLITFPRGL
jgi:hypothetical protein